MKHLFLIILCVFIGRNVQSQLSEVNHWESLVYADDEWRYLVGKDSTPSVEWLKNDYDTSGWFLGRGGFGYGDNDDTTILPAGTLSVFIRTQFFIEDTAQIASAILNLDYDDGFVAWINGVEIARQNLGSRGDYPAFNLPATDHEAVVKDGKSFPVFYISKEILTNCLLDSLNTLAIQVNNTGPGSSDMSCIPYLSVGLKSAASIYRPVPAWFNIPVSSNLPLVVIHSNGNTIQADTKVMVNLGIVDNGPGKLNSVTDSMNVYSGYAGLDYRGSSSMMFPKKNLSLEIRHADGSDSAVNLLGMPEESDWVLHGPYTDKVMARNFLAYNIFTQMGHYAPRTKYVNLNIDDDYQGVYVLLEKIKRDKNRVALAKLLPADTSGLQLTGGYIFKIDRSSDGSYRDGWESKYNGSGSQKVFFAYHYPKWEDIVPAQAAYIKNKVDSFELVLKSIDFKDPQKGYRKWIDVRSFIDYFLMIELSKNTDGYRLSTFLHKDRDDRDPLIYMGPVWDYDLAYGNANYLNADQTYGWNYQVAADGWGNPFWWSRFLQDPYYTGKLKCRWEELRQGILSDEHLDVMIDSAISIMGPSIDINFVRWPIHGVWVWPNVYVGNTYNEDVQFMKNWISNRITWLEANMPGTCNPSSEEVIDNPPFNIRAFPNPAKGNINIGIYNPGQENLSLCVFNLNGQLVQSQQLRNEVLQQPHISLPPGMYLVKVIGETFSNSVKIMMQ